MELYIRSQNKKKLIKFTNLLIQCNITNDKYTIINYISDENYIELGYYRTEKRAIEILNEIENVLIGILPIKIVKEKKQEKKLYSEMLLDKIYNTNAIPYIEKEEIISNKVSIYSMPE